MRREIADVLETVKRAKDRSKGCTLLIGAGCSVKAGIPTANGFVEIIRKDYPRAYDRAAKKTYPHVMAELLMAERRDLISQYINNAKLNWAYLAIAQLLKHGFVDRVLTVNFDPLVMRACALVGIFPAVYDFAASQNFDPDFIARQSVFYLHGQHTGFVALNTESEVERLSQHLGPVFTDSGRGRVWIVAGYSGENDPVFDHLAKMGRYDNGLYWICYKDNPPQTHVQDRLLVAGKDCFCVQGFDADDFFVKLAQGLDCFPPAFVQTPFTHLENLLEPVLPYSQPGSDSSLEAIPKKLLQDAIEKIEKPGFLALRARDLLMAGNFNSVIEMETELAKTPTSELADLIAWGYISAGNKFALEAETKSGGEADGLWVLAGEKYEAALKIFPGAYWALYNWGNALVAQARTQSGEESDRLFALAGDKFAAALKIEPEVNEALYNWGNALVAQAQTKSGKEADQLWTQAAEKYEEAVKIKRDEDALNNWGNVLRDRARTKSGAEADQLRTQAIEKYEEALKINPDKVIVLRNWGDLLHDQARTKSGAEAEQLWTRAAEKYEEALKIKPDEVVALLNWGNALVAQAQTKSGEEADRLWTQAGEKYEAVLRINANNVDALYSWGAALDSQARTKTGAEADGLWARAAEKYEAVLRINANEHVALNNWANTLYAQALTRSGEEADRVWRLVGEKYEAALKIEPKYHTALYNWSLALTAQAGTKSQNEASQLLELANQKLSAARALAPELYSVTDQNPAVESKKRSNVRAKKTKKKSVRNS